MNPLISVIVPIYNVEKYLARCVDSIVNQTYKNLEIILVDDGSPDRCSQMCDDYAQKEWLFQQVSISALLTAMTMCLMTFLNVCWML